MPLVSLRGRPEVRLGGFTSLAGGPLAGFWAPADDRAAPHAAPLQPAPEPASAGSSAPEAPAAPTRRAGRREAAADGGRGARPIDLDALLAGLMPPSACRAGCRAAAAAERRRSRRAACQPEAPSRRPPRRTRPEADLDALLASLK